MKTQGEKCKMKKETLEQKATLITAEILTWARSHKIGPDASHLTKKVIKLAYSEFSRGYDAGMTIATRYIHQHHLFKLRASDYLGLGCARADKIIITPMKTLTQLSKEELEAFGQEFPQHEFENVSLTTLGTAEWKSWLLAHDRRIIEAAFAATEMDISELNVGDDSEVRGILAALSEVNNLKQEFLK